MGARQRRALAFPDARVRHVSRVQHPPCCGDASAHPNRHAHTHYQLLNTTYYFLLPTYYLLLTTYHLLLTTHYSLLTTYYLGIRVWTLAKSEKVSSIAELPSSLVRVVLPTAIGEGRWVPPEHRVELVQHSDSACMVATSIFWFEGQLVMLPSSTPGESFKWIAHTVPLERQYEFQQLHKLAPPSVEKVHLARPTATPTQRDAVLSLLSLPSTEVDHNWGGGGGE